MNKNHRNVLSVFGSESIEPGCDPMAINPSSTRLGRSQPTGPTLNSYRFLWRTDFQSAGNQVYSEFGKIYPAKSENSGEYLQRLKINMWLTILTPTEDQVESKI